ncbi:MAG: hypothetical protein P8183_08160, partial [Anaerolineae bacterium]
MKKWVFGLLAILLLGACSPTVASSPDIEPGVTAVPEAKATATPSALKPVATSEPAETAPVDSAESSKPDKMEAVPAGAVLVFHRTGGFAGVDQRWVVYADGRIDMPDGTQKQVDASQVQALLDTVQTANFFDLNDSYVPLDNCCDRFTYSITVQLDGQVKTVNTIDDAPE